MLRRCVYYVYTYAFAEKLRRKDAEVARALEEKQRLIAEILNIAEDDFDHVADIAAHASEDKADKDAKEVLLAALAQGNIKIWQAKDYIRKRYSV